MYTRDQNSPYALITEDVRMKLSEWRICIVISVTAFLAACSGAATEPNNNETFSYTVQADPPSGYNPLEGVSLVFTAEGTATGTVTYRNISCFLDDSGTQQFITNDNVAVLENACSYSASGTHIVRTEGERNGKTHRATTIVVVSEVPSPGERTTEERPDEVSGQQMKGVYYVPKTNSDAAPGQGYASVLVVGSERDVFTYRFKLPASSSAADRYLDVGGTETGRIEISLRVAQKWIAQETGKKFRVDTYKSFADIRYVLSSKTAAELAALGENAASVIREDFVRAGFNSKDKTYIVYAELTNPSACSGLSSEDDMNMVILFLQGTYNGQPCSNTVPFPYDTNSPVQLWEYWLMRELLKTRGYPDPRALNYSLANGGCVTDSVNDLLSCGDITKPVEFDRDEKEYHKRSGDILGKDGVTKVKNFANDPILIQAP